MGESDFGVIDIVQARVRRVWRATALLAMVSVVAGCGPFGPSKASQPPGTIVFGTGAHRVSAYQWVIRNERSTFKDGQFIGLVAQLQSPLGRAPVTVSVTNIKTKTVTYQAMLTNTNPKWIQLAEDVPVDAFVKAGTGGTVPGSYRLEYLQSGRVLAEGTFRIIR